MKDEHTYDKKAAPYLAGVLGVPDHPRNLGFTKGAKPDFCLSEFTYLLQQAPLDLKSYLRRCTVLDCPKIAGAKAPIAPVLTRPQYMLKDKCFFLTRPLHYARFKNLL